MWNWLNIKTYIGVALVALFLAVVTSARADDGAFVLKPIPRPLPTPEWLETCQRFSFDVKTVDDGVRRDLQMVCGPTNAYTEAGFTGGTWAWDGKDGFYDIFTFKPVDTAPFRARVDEAHKQGLKVIGEMIRMWDPELLYVKHPEWQELPTPDAKPRGPEKKTELVPVTGCWNSGYGDYYIRQCVELVKHLDWDGANLDGFGCWTTCYCPACRKAYKEDTGGDIPFQAAPRSNEVGMQSVSSGDLNNPEYRRYIKWRLNRYNQFVNKWVRALDAAKPGFAELFWTTGPGRWWHWSYAPLAECSDAANRLVQAPILELFWDFPPDQGSNLLPSFTARYYRGIMAERPVWMLPYFCTQGQQPAVAPPVECAFRLLTVVTNGCHAAQAVWQHNDTLPPDYYSKLIEAREPWTTNTKSVKWAAMLVSESSRLLYGVPGKRKELGNSWIGSGVDTPDKTEGLPGDRRLPAHMESAIGVFRAAEEDHLPLDMITEQDVEEGARLNMYKVLILPNAACLSQKALENIRSFVRAGGGLVAMQESSLCDEFGTRRPDFGLADLFKVSFEAVQDHTATWPNYKNACYVKMTKHQITKSKVIDENYRHDMDIVDYIGMTTKVKPMPGSDTIIVRGDDREKMLMPCSPLHFYPKSPPPKPVEPFLLVSSEGKGRVAYFAADIGQSYFVVPHQYERALIFNAIRWVSGGSQPPVKVIAPMCVQSTFYEQNNGKRLIVHLLNELNSNANRALPEGNTSMREEIVPVHDIKVVFRQAAIRRVHLEPECLNLKTTPTKDGVAVTVPKLEMHSMVVAEQ